MALPDLTGQNIQDTYQRILQVSSSGEIADGTGSLYVPPTASFAISASYAASSSYEIEYEISSSYAQTASHADNFFIKNSLTASANISASGTIIANQITSSGGARFGGNVGIGGAAGSKTLQVTGTMKSSGEAFWSHFDNLSSNSRFRDDLSLFFGVNRVLGWRYNSTLDKLVLTSGSANHTLTLDGSGNISGSGNIIGVTGSFDYVKTDKLQVGTAGGTDVLSIDGGDLQLENGKQITFSDIGDGNTGRVRIVGSEDNDIIQMHVDNSNSHVLALTTTGVGVGTTSPGEKLEVVGNISASGDLTVNNINGIINGGTF